MVSCQGNLVVIRQLITVERVKRRRPAPCRLRAYARALPFTLCNTSTRAGHQQHAPVFLAEFGFDTFLREELQVPSRLVYRRLLSRVLSLDRFSRGRSEIRLLPLSGWTIVERWRLNKFSLTVQIIH